MSAADQLFTQAIERKNGQSLTQEELTKRYYDAIRDHPFVHRGNYHTCVRRNSLIFNENNNNNSNVSHIRDSNGNTVCILLRNAFPKKVTELATSVLNDAATRTSLRANIFGGESPFSGIAGYYDYWGSPIEYKCRKTSFTCETIEKWPRVFPLVEYASKLYEKICPEAYEGQEKAIPKAVQIHGSPFSTLTINQRFRTAMHTDAGDFDDGFGLISVLDGSFEGCHLGFPYFGVCVELRVGDLIFFETHHCHANTELELLPVKGQPMNYWSRLSCVFYYRAVLGEEKCKTEYERRLKNEKKAKGANNNSITFDDETKELVDQQNDPKTHQSLLKNGVPENENGENYNRPATVFSAGLQTPFNSLLIHRLPDVAGASLSPISLIQQVFNKEAEHILKYAEQLTSSSSTKQQQKQQEQTSSSFVKSATELFLYLFNELPREPVLFNERISALRSFRPNSSNFGLFQRSSISFHPVDTNKESLGARQSAPATGDFSETASFVKFASDESVQKVFAEDSLNQVLTPALLDMWNDAKALWFSKVLIDWKKIKDRHDSSDDESEFKFNWNNTGEVNKTFFDLCDVASEVMLAMLQQEEASPGQKARFWAAFAYHLFKECQSVNEMPETAITMKKLNVKLKDYQFGGTRYFKDQNEEEKARRLLRKQKITEARKKRGGKSVAALKRKNKSGRRRRRHGTDSDDTSSSDYSDSSDDSDSSSSEDAEQKRLKHEQHERNWLDNDDFDYQNEDVNIKYDARKGLPTPDENAKRFDFVFGIGKKIEEREPPEAIAEQQQEQEEKAPAVTNNKKLTAMEKFLLQQKEKKQQALMKQHQQPQEKNQQQDDAASTSSSLSKAKILLIVGNKTNNTAQFSRSLNFAQQTLPEHTKALYDKLSELVNNPPQTKSATNNNNNHQQQPLKSFEVWAREIRMTLCCMMEVIRTFLATFSTASSSLLLNQTNKNVSLRQLALRFLPMIEQNEKELKNDAVFIYEQSPVLLEEEESRGSNDNNRIVFNLVTRGCATKKGKKDSTTLMKKGKKNDDDDDSSDEDYEDDDDTSCCSSSSSSDDDNEDENSVDEDDASPKKTKTKRRPTTRKTTNKKTKTKNKSTTTQRKPTLAAEKKKMEEFNTKAKEHLLKKAQEVKGKLEEFEDFFCKQQVDDQVHYEQSNLLSANTNQDAAVDASDSSSSPNNNTKSFQLSTNLIVEVETREVAEIEQQQQQFISSSSFDLIVIDAVFTSQNEEMTKVRAKNLINIIRSMQNATSSSLLLWIAPVLTRDRFHFMLTDTVREAFNHSSLPKFGHLLHQLCHPRAFSCDEDEDVVSSPQQLSYLAESFLGEASLSEFDMVLSNCQRKVYCL